MKVPRTFAFLALVLGAPVACEPKEARDPADILAEDPAFLEPQYQEALDEGDSPGGPPPADQADPQSERPATYEQCRAAVRHLEELGIEIAIREEPDPNRKQQLREQKQELLNSGAVQRRIRRSADDCVARGTTRAEAACIAQVQSAEDIDACQ